MTQLEFNAQIAKFDFELESKRAPLCEQIHKLEDQEFKYQQKVLTLVRELGDVKKSITILQEKLHDIKQHFLARRFDALSDKTKSQFEIESEVIAIKEDIRVKKFSTLEQIRNCQDRVFVLNKQMNMNTRELNKIRHQIKDLRESKRKIATEIWLAKHEFILSNPKETVTK